MIGRLKVKNCTSYCNEYCYSGLFMPSNSLWVTVLVVSWEVAATHKRRDISSTAFPCVLSYVFLITHFHERFISTKPVRSLQVAACFLILAGKLGVGRTSKKALHFKLRHYFSPDHPRIYGASNING